MNEDLFRPFVYGLVDPAESGHVRYVGMAMRARRPREHAHNARRQVTKHSHLFHWIRKIQSEGREPAIIKLEQLPPETSRKFLGFVEICYIRSLREIGHSLTNVSNGGGGGSDTKTRDQKRASMLRHFAEHPEERERLSRQWTDERRKNNPNIGRKASAETKAKQSVALKGRQVHPVTERMRRLASERSKGNKHNLGRKATDATRATLSNAGKKRFEDPEAVAKHRKAVGSPEARAKIGVANSKRVWTAEARINAGKASKSAHARRKAAKNVEQ